MSLATELPPVPDSYDPDTQRKRYEELRAAAQDAGTFEAALAAAPANPQTIDPELLLARDTIPGGWYTTIFLKRWETLRLVDTHGTQGVSAQIWNARDMAERFNAADTTKLQWTAKLSKGRVLFSDMGRVVFSITDDTGGWHDCLTGHSTPASNAARYGSRATEGPGLRNDRENFIKAALKLGLAKTDVHPSITFFSGVKVDAQGAFEWDATRIRPGAHIDLRAEMDLAVTLSNCPHPLAPGAYAPKPVEFMVWRSPPPAADDLCRTAGAEAARGFDLTDPLFT